MRAAVLGLVTLATLAGSACHGSSSRTAVVCIGPPGACECDLGDPGPGSAPKTTCDDRDPPGTVCCADPSWPRSGTCVCVTSSIFCGIVPGYFVSNDGGPGEDGCVCSSAPESGAIGATCYPGATTTPGNELGICCSFSANAPGSLGQPSCACAAGLHTCGAGGTQVASCSASNVPVTAFTCDQGTTQVPSCS
jgi:hypothetical protein